MLLLSLHYFFDATLGLMSSALHLRPASCWSNFSRLQFTRDVWNDLKFETFLKKHFIFLNVHKQCGNHHNPVTLRNPILIQSKARKIRGLRRCTQRDCKFVPVNRDKNGATNIGTNFRRLFEGEAPIRLLSEDDLAFDRATLSLKCSE